MLWFVVLFCFVYIRVALLFAVVCFVLDCVVVWCVVGVLCVVPLRVFGFVCCCVVFGLFCVIVYVVLVVRCDVFCVLWFVWRVCGVMCGGCCALL